METHGTSRPPTYSPTEELAQVRLRDGTLRGRHANGVYLFRNVPFAAPPFGPRRFRVPQPVEPWSGVRDALAWGARPLQLRGDPEMDAMIPDPAAFGEDCLNLNVWTPELGAARLPVMVFIAGGMFEICSGASYDGSRFARDGVVCVTINYRVGPDGFLSLGEGNAETGDTNRGLLDQIAALAWVREHIAAFGGDPANVTVFGESAGAMSIGTLLSMPRAEGLFRRAILQSGAAHTAMTAATARLVRDRFAEVLAVPPTREAIAAVPIDRFVAALAEVKSQFLAISGSRYGAAPGGADAALPSPPDRERWGAELVTSLLPWQPVVDGDVVPAFPIDRIAAGAAASVDVLVGSNVDDWRVFAIANGLMDVTEEVLTGTVADHGFRALAAYGLPAERGLAAYRAMHPGASPGDLLAAVQTDWVCRIPGIRLAEAHAGGSGATYMYEFAWRSPLAGGIFGACHAAEIPFVFDTLDRGAEQVAGGLLGASPPQALADAMHRAWIAFATTGDPGWPRYDRDRRATMRFDVTPTVVDDPRAAERALWAGVR